MSIEKIEARLAKGEVLILDGGTGTEIKRRSGLPGSSDLAVSQMIKSPELIRELHEDYIRAGADVITANTYDCNRSALEQVGIDPSQVAHFTAIAVEMARGARDGAGHGREVYIAGSLGPLGSDYDPDDVPPLNVCLSVYREQVEAMVSSGVDFVLVETAARVRSARAGVKAAVEMGVTAWASLIADSKGRVKSGESWGEAVEILVSDGASAVLINCAQPEDLSLAMKELAQQGTVPVGAYAQGARYKGFGWEFGPSMSPQRYLDYARQWVDAGARIIGGCCGTTPEHIRALGSLRNQT